MINLPTTGLSNDNTNIDYISNDRESDSTIYLHENEYNRKSYPQRNNRAKLNYRDLERGLYEEIRQSMWTLSGPTFMNKNNKRYCGDDDEEEQEIIDLSIDDDDDDEKSTDQMHRRLWCICKKPWDHSRLMLRCDSCANWYHGDCIGVSSEQAKALDINGDQFICPSCRGMSYPIMERAKTSEESILIKRKRSDCVSPVREKGISSKNISHDESTKRQKPNIFFQRDSLTESQTHCIVHGCNNWAKPSWVYCSPACIRRHINNTLQTIQRSKGMDNVDIPTSDDILLYESQSKNILEKNLVPKIEDLCTWINQHPSYEIIKPALRQSILLTTKQSKDLAQTFSNRTKSKPLLTSVGIHPKPNTKLIPNKKSSIQLQKPTSNPTSNINNTADIRSKVPTALYDKIIMRLEKNGEKNLIKQNIRTIVNKIEEEMFRVYGKVDTSYKNKFRSLLANISNMNNNFFYKQILSKELTAKQIVAMKSEDMLPPEEKEKRKDQWEKEVQRIINDGQQKAEEMARRVRTKVTRQGLVDNDAHHLPIFNSKEQNSSGEEIEKSKDNQLLKQSMEIKPTTSKSIAKIGSDTQTSSSILPGLPPASLIKKMDSHEPSKLPITEELNPIFSTVDLDNDYIEPESPTGVDALIYDEDDNNDDDLNNINTSSQPSTSQSPIENTEFILPYPQIIRDDYNPSKTKTETTPIIRLPNQWRGVIHPSDTKMPCQSVHIYGESDYLISHIPEQLTILGRLRLGDLWDYIRESLTVRDVLILTLISSSLNTNDNEIFLQYVDTMHTSGRAAVISKCTNSLIRDMYILAADTKECPSNVLSSLFLPITFESKQLFLVIIGTGKRSIKSLNRSDENQLLNNNVIYKPVALQDSSITRDPRLLKNKDPRLNKTNTSKNVTLPTQQSNNTKQTLVQYSSIPTSTIVAGDNLIEENMDVDDDQDEKHKKQITTSSSSNSAGEFNDIDYRFLDQDMDLQIATAGQINDHRKQRRTSRFSDLLPNDVDRTKKSKSNIPIEQEEKSAIVNTDFRLNNGKLASSKSVDKHISSSLSSKFRPIINSTQSFLPAINTKDNLTSKPIRFSFSNDNWTKQTLPINPIRSPTMLNLIIQQQKTKNRFSSSTNERRSSSNNNYMTHYHDFDQPQE